MCIVIEHVEFILFYMLGHEKVCGYCLFYNQYWNYFKRHVMSTDDEGGDGEEKLIWFYYNNKLGMD